MGRDGVDRQGPGALEREEERREEALAIALGEVVRAPSRERLRARVARAEVEREQGEVRVDRADVERACAGEILPAIPGRPIGDAERQRRGEAREVDREDAGAEVSDGPRDAEHSASSALPKTMTSGPAIMRERARRASRADR